MKNDYIFRIKFVLLLCLQEHGMAEKVDEVWSGFSKEGCYEAFLDKHAHDNIIFPRGDYTYLDNIIRSELLTDIQDFIIKTLPNEEVTEKEGVTHEEQ